MRTYYVYMHKREDDNTPFYIGCATKQEKMRGKHKYKRAYDFGQRRPLWFKTRDEAGGLTVDIVFETNIKKEAFDKEYELVNKYGRSRFNNGLLVNECLGGSGAPGQPHSDITRLKKSITKLGKKNPMFGRTGDRHPNSRKILDSKTGKMYSSISEAAEKNGHKMKTLYNWLSGHRENPTSLRFA